jgi:hypothetical protein
VYAEIDEQRKSSARATRAADASAYAYVKPARARIK